MFTGFNSVLHATPTATLYVDPSLSYGDVGESFSVDINVADVDDLYGWQVNMTFNPDVLEVTDITEGHFLMDQPEGTTGDKRVENEMGWATFSWLTLGQHTGVDGDGILATVELSVLSEGESLLNITNSETFLLMITPPPAYAITAIPHIPENGFFSSLVAPPVAEFTWSPTLPSKNGLVTFNASASSDDEEIVSYKWAFGDGTTEFYTGTNLTAITTHQYTTSGTKDVVLNVTDNLGLSSIKTRKLSVRFTHDVAVTDVSLSDAAVTAGETVDIDVTIKNLGEEAESVDVVVYYDETEVETRTTNLAKDESKTLSFSWETTDVAPDDYIVSAEAEIEGEEYAANNIATGGTVTVNPVGGALPMELIIVVVVVVVIVVAAGVFLYLRR